MKPFSKIEFAKGMMGKEFTMTDFAEDGEMLDAAAVTIASGPYQSAP